MNRPTYVPRVRAVCPGCGSSFEPLRVDARYCPGCSSGSLGPEDVASWRAFLAGYDLGWHMAMTGAGDAAFAASAGRWPAQDRERAAAGLALARRKAAEYRMAGLV